MHTYTAHFWSRGEQPFVDNRFSQRHVVQFELTNSMERTPSSKLRLSPAAAHDVRCLAMQGVRFSNALNVVLGRERPSKVISLLSTHVPGINYFQANRSRK